MFFPRRHARQVQPPAGALKPARLLVVLACLPGAAAAQLQFGAAATVTSDYSARGVSLSRGHPSLQLRVDLDDASGWYAGALVAPRAAPDTDGGGLLQGYGGYAARLPSGLGWEAGASATAFHHAAEYNYGEVYAGLSFDRLGARLYLSPSYYGGGRSAYAELNGFHPLREGLRLLGHIGYLHGLGHDGARPRDRADLSVALSADVGNCQLRLAWVASGPRPGPAARPARALSVSASYGF